MSTTYTASATVLAKIDAKLTRADELGTASDTVALTKALMFPEDAVISEVYRRTFQVSGDDPTVVPVSPLEFTDGFGRSRELATIRALMIYNGSLTTRLRVGNISAVGELDGLFWGNDDLGGGVVLAPGGTFFMTGPSPGYTMNGDLQLQGVGDDCNDVEVVAVG